MPGGLRLRFRRRRGPGGLRRDADGFHRLTFLDRNDNGLPDDCDIDCGDRGGPCDLAACGLIPDCNPNGISDHCEPDRNSNGIADGCHVAAAARGTTPGRLVATINHLAETESQLDANVNTKLCLDTLVIRLARLAGDR